MPAGRPSEFTQEIADELCERIATTPRGLDFICNGEDRFPSARTVNKWLSDRPEFVQSYLRARERQADLIFDECLEIADDDSRDVRIIGGEDGEREVLNTEFVQRAKLRIDTRMRMAGKLAPKKYGEKLAHVGGGADDPPIQTKGEMTIRFVRPGDGDGA
jgi:hypothetical protein